MDKGDSEVPWKIKKPFHFPIEWNRPNRWVSIAALLVIVIVFLYFWLPPQLYNLSISRELTRHEKIWQSQNIKNYDFVLERNGFISDGGPVLVQIRDGNLTSAVYTYNLQPVNNKTFGDVLTIDSLFGVIYDAYKNRYDTIFAKYNDRIGYPTTISLYVDKTWTDAGMTYGITDFEIVK